MPHMIVKSATMTAKILSDKSIDFLNWKYKNQLAFYSHFTPHWKYRPKNQFTFSTENKEIS